MDRVIEIGMPTLIELDSLEDCVRICKALSLDFIELNMNMPPYQLAQLHDIDKYRGDLFFTVHMDEALNPFDFNDRVSNAYLDTMVETMTFAKTHDIPVLNIHMPKGIFITLPDKRVLLYDRYSALFREKLELFIDVCEKTAGGSGIRICVENTGGFLDFQRAAIERLLESELFALTFDIGHDHAAGNPDEAFILSHNEKLIHMHIHDAIGKKNHLEIGTGEIDVESKLALAQKLGCRCVLETKTVEALTTSCAKLQHFI